MRARKPRWASRGLRRPGAPFPPRMPAARSLARPLPFTSGIGILERGHDAAHAGRDEGVGAGRRAAVVAAGLERHVGGRALRRLAAGRERHRLGVRPRPARACQPSPMMRPPCAITQPTFGFGVAVSRPRAASASGARHQGMVLGGEAHPTCPAPRGSRRGSRRRPRSCDRRRRSGCRPPCRASSAPPSPSRPAGASRPRARPGRGASARCA